MPQELDYATNFLADGPGQWKDSGLGEAFRAAVINPDIINVIDWKPYGPSYGALASFLSTGIKQDGQLVGVFCTQLPPESRPVEVSEMQPILETAMQSIDTAANYYLEGQGTCDTVLDAQSWEYMMEKFNQLPSLPLGALFLSFLSFFFLVLKEVPHLLRGVCIAGPWIFAGLAE